MTLSVDIIDCGGLDAPKQQDVVYERVQRNRPFVLRGLPWAAANKWDFKFLREKHGETVTWVYFYDRKPSAESFLVQVVSSRQKMSVADFFARFCENPQAWSIKECTQIFKDCPDLLNDVKFNQIYAAAGKAKGPHDSTSGCLSQGDAYMFVGGPGGCTGLHADLVDWNVAFQAVGQKHWKFYAPEDEPLLYPQTLIPVDGGLYSHVDPFDTETIRAKYPKFLQATEYVVITQPGDLVSSKRRD